MENKIVIILKWAFFTAFVMLGFAALTAAIFIKGATHQYYTAIVCVIMSIVIYNTKY